MSDLSHGDFDETTLRSAVDVKRFARLAADDAAGFARMMREYLAETREIAASWPHMLQLGKVDEVLMQLHTCKGGAAIFGFARMIAMIGELEKNPNIASGDYDAQVFEKELVLVEYAIAAWEGGLLA